MRVSNPSWYGVMWEQEHRIEVAAASRELNFDALHWLLDRMPGARPRHPAAAV